MVLTAEKIEGAEATPGTRLSPCPHSVCGGTMKVFFSDRSIPELADLPKEQREKIWQRCHPKGFRHWQTKVALCVYIVVYVCGSYVAVFAQPDEGFSWMLFAAGMLVIALGHVGLLSVHAHFTRPHIREELKK